MRERMSFAQLIIWSLFFVGMMGFAFSVNAQAQCNTATGFSLPIIDDNPNDNLTWDVPFNYFGHYFSDKGGYHPAEDWNLTGGSGNADLGKPVYAIADGTVVKVSNLGTLGTLVAIRHTGNFTIPAKSGTEHGQNFSYPSETVTSIYSIYLHINIDSSTIYVGACVKKGESVIGHIIDPGGGPHLHFEIRKTTAVNSSTWSLVGSASNWATDKDGYDGYYINLQEMVDDGQRDGRDFINANRNTTFYEGFLDNASCDTIDGWAWDSSQPNTPVNVDIYDGNALLTTVLASNYRNDLEVKGKGNGQHAFSIPTPFSLKDGLRHSVWVKIAGPNHNLSDSPKSLLCGNIGYLEGASCSGVSGWAANGEQLATPVNVNIFVVHGSITDLYTVLANQSRPDVGSFLGDNGLHGFNFNFPSSLTVGTNRISVKVDGSNFELNSSPQSITCGTSPSPTPAPTPTPPTTPNYDGYVEVADCNAIRGWAADKNRLNTSINVSIYDGATLLTTIPANQLRSDVGTYLGDNGLHGFNIPTPASLINGQPHNLRVRYEASGSDLNNSARTITCGTATPTPTPPTTPNYDGYVEVADCNAIRGWAADKNRLNTSINVSIYDGNTLLTTIPANQLRSDVGSYLGDNGLHGFNIQTPASFTNGQPHNLRVRYEASNSDLNNSPKSITCGTTPTPTPTPTPIANNYDGYVEVADCNSIRGWAADKNRPNISINVSVYDGNTLLTTIPANQSRPDVGNYLGDNGLHGFNIPTPASLTDGQPHTLRVRFETSNSDLNNSPKSVTCNTTTTPTPTPAPTNYIGYVDVEDCNVISGWAADRNRLNTSINVSIYDGATLLTTIPANQSRSDVGSYLGDNGLHGFNIPTPASLKNGQPHTLRVRFEASSSDLNNSPKSITCGTTSTPTPTPTPTNYVGYVEVADCNAIRGWAADRNRLNNSINVSIYDGATLLTTIPANQSRPDVGSYLGDNGLHGFNIPTPASLTNGQSHTVRVRFETSTSDLNNSPGTITCSINPSPSVSSIQPNQVILNQTTTLTVNGSNFQNGFSATVISPGGSFPIANSGLTFVNGNQVKVQVTMGGTAPYSSTLSITNPDGQSANGTFQVVAPAAPSPTISSISPSTVTINQTTTLTVNGSNFQNGFSASVITPNGTFPIASTGLNFVNANQVTVQVTMGNTPPYTATLRITNPDGKSVDGTFQVVGGTPSISSISPSGPSASGSNQTLTVNGNNFLTGLTVDVTFPDGSGTTLSGTQISNVTSSSFKMQVTLNSSGIWGIRVRNPDNKVSGVFNFTVQPQITGISPSSPTRSNLNQNVTVLGTGFQSGLTVTINFPGGGSTTLSGSQISSVTNTSFVMAVTLNGTGNWSIRANNPNGTQSNTFGFNVQ